MSKTKHLKEIIAAVLEINERMTCLVENFEALDITSDLDLMNFKLIDNKDLDLRYLMNDTSRLQYHLKQYRRE